jgi:farnesyl diphosphate synthase
VIYKTAFYSFYLPVALAMHMAGISSEEDLKQARDILIPLGEYSQIQVPPPSPNPPRNICGRYSTFVIDSCDWGG